MEESGPGRQVGGRLPGRGSGRHQGSEIGSCLKHGWSQGG